jgi:hypothetical protein
MTDYYVDPANGSNSNDGTGVDDALADLSRWNADGSATLSAGDTVYIRGYDAVGAAVTTWFNPSRQGDVNGEPITITGYRDETPRFDTSGSNMNSVYAYEIQNWVFRGIEFAGGADFGLLVSGDPGDRGNDVLVENCVAHGYGSAGFRLRTECANVTFRNCHSYGQTDGGSGDGFTVNDRADNLLFEDCTATYNADDGFDMYDARPVDGGATFRRCFAGFNGYEFGTTNVVGNGNGFKLGGVGSGGDTGGHTLERCVAYRNDRRGFDGNNADNPLSVYHCTAWDTGVGFRRTGDGAEHVYRNNLAWGNDAATSFNGSVDSRGNSWDLDVGDPLFRDTATDEDGTPATPGEFLRLDADSPAIGAGTSVAAMADGDGRNPDLGAFQFAASDGAEDRTASLNYYDGSTWNRVETTVLFRSDS